MCSTRRSQAGGSIVCGTVKADLRAWSTIHDWAGLMFDGAAAGVVAGPPWDAWSSPSSLSSAPARRVGPSVGGE
eukprot:1210278-Alexandrium_andersonii.AAC.1